MRRLFKSQDGGPAFPGHSHESYIDEEGSRRYFEFPTYTEGMSVRDYFAAAALAGVTAADTNDEKTVKDCAHLAYYIADAMLAERDKDESGPE